MKGWTMASKVQVVAVVALSVTVFGCGEDEKTSTNRSSGPSSTTTTVSGTITLPSAVTDRCAMIAVDDDTTGQNTTPQRPDGTYLVSYQLVSGTSLAFTIDTVPAGTYFLWAFVDTDSNVSDPTGDCELMGGPETDDFFGHFDTGLVPPSAANVTIPQASGATHNFAIGVYP